ncbi:MAG: amino acid permease [Candidatus Margulisiibacteriota bacterium]|nr:MAG: amino acid permease [Candidatus Margulisbacteria bacterium GWD2_39_127]OGI02844.1 MAG: amino acid permease [Candidatus Margulisbacteria bacterium GWF2_38_17]OGI09625.1 MAG: amino acid permease [Candidatus Margulisbacteria bacterium GWE2_39_32]PZM83050.1 MAG: amino acid permease [Candidatus Margulisiibacteriota bacterium]HAR63668.1 amino acid permease [Candidatus Margulisiibacteriota bacterium]
MPGNPQTKRYLSVFDSIAIVMGIVIGAGIFKTPSLVAASAGNEVTIIMVWLGGGIISLIGALCYAELTSTYPNIGGEYFYLNRAFGKAPSFLFAWARMAVIQTGSIAMMAFLIGDYASNILNLGLYSSSYYAACTIVILTAINIAGVSQGSWIQKILIISTISGLLFISFSGFFLASSDKILSQISPSSASGIGKAMVFVLLTYSGWNEAAYLSSEVRDPQRTMAKTLIYSIAIITAVYVMINIAFIEGLGIQAMSKSELAATSLMENVFGGLGAKLTGLLVAIVALSTINGIIITGARTNYALGRDFKPFEFLGKWKEQVGNPVNALIVQGIISIMLIGIGTGTRNGFVMMVEYTAPVFWLFFLLAGISIFVLRKKEPSINRPFKVPLYPILPAVFCLICMYMMYSSIIYTGIGAVIGIAVLLTGLPIFFLKYLCSKTSKEV